MDRKDQLITNKLKELITEGQQVTSQGSSNYYGWMVSVQNLVNRICSDQNSYNQQCKAIIAAVDNLKGDYSTIQGRGNIQAENRKLRSRMLSLILELEKDYEKGLLKEIEYQLFAENFDSFLDHGEEYFRNGKKMEAGVLVSAIFEDSIRKLGKKNGIEHRNVEQIINGLTTMGVVGKVKSKRIKSASGLRNKALHASWDEFDLHDVEESIRITRELLEIIEMD